MSRAKDELADLEILEHAAEQFHFLAGTEMTPEREQCSHVWELENSRTLFTTFDRHIGHCVECGLVRYVDVSIGTQKVIKFY